MQTSNKTKAILVAIIMLGFAIRYMVWIYPMFGAQGLTIYDTGTYAGFGLSYIQSISSMNLTAMAEINPGVPPLAMILTGLSAHTFGQLVGQVQASLLAPIAASSLTAIPAYIVARRYSAKWSLLAPLLIELDPFQVQFSSAYLDSIGTLFALTSTTCLLNQAEEKRWFTLAIFFASLAVLCKLTFAGYVVLLSLLMTLTRQITVKRGALYTAIPVASIALSPWVWTPTTLSTSIQGNLTFNNTPLASIIGPFAIGVPQSLPWYILTYLGLGHVSWNTLPLTSTFTLFLALLYRAVKRELNPPKTLTTAASAMVLTLFLIPRNYWTYSWAGGFLQGVLAKQFYPYYFYPLAPFAATLAAPLIAGLKGDTIKERTVTYPIYMAAILSPIALIMNLGFPYWDFLFTLIYSSTQGSWILEGTAAAAITTATLIATITAAELLHRKSRPNGQSGRKRREQL
ncbi:hypothetical protein HRbin02_00727 [Candidatus Calditenuaceae archaeon HR02]|nr:hypothetical protein HRbin02_00727 [Candidatus Calditenuaceae archaeon HR02]